VPQTKLTPEKLSVTSSTPTERTPAKFSTAKLRTIVAATEFDADASRVCRRVREVARFKTHLLLETADLTGARSSRSMIAYAPLAYARCVDRTVTLTAGSDQDSARRVAGRALVNHVAKSLRQFVIDVDEDEAVFRFPASDAFDEAVRLREPNPLDVLREMARYMRESADNAASSDAVQIDAAASSNAADFYAAQVDDAPDSNAAESDAAQGDDAHFPLVAGAFGFDFVDSFEDLPAVEKPADGFADFEFMVPSRVILLNHRTNQAQVVALTGPEEGEMEALVQAIADAGAATPVRARVQSSSDEIAGAGTATPVRACVQSCSDEIADAGADNTRAGASQTALSPALENHRDTNRTVTARPTMSDTDFRDAVARLQERIAAGDVYQVVPSRGFEIACPDPRLAYDALRNLNPSPYMFYFETNGTTVFGASPESCLTFEAESRRVYLHPIAGTRPRRLDRGEYSHENDTRTELSLRLDAKETAEHVMLVDLARNDMARIARPGSRHVSQLLGVEHYSHVSHLVSTVTATLADEFDALDAYRACMNMGTLTGAPKVEATRLIRQVEGRGRGVYGGAVGYLAADGSFDSCITIRSAVVRDGRAMVQAGAGVVAASNPQTEADETRHKASAVLTAIARSQNASVEVAR
jgi:anthranilate synthase component 1